MTGKRLKNFLISAAGLGIGTYAALRLISRPRPGKPFLHSPKPLIVAHRGGSGLWPENTLYAFERAVALGVHVLELDIHATADGTLVVMHDDRVDRLTDGSGEIRSKTLAELKKLDAGFGWTQDGGKTYPYRGQGITIPTLEEVFSAFPGLRINIDIKQQVLSIVEPFARLLEEHHKLDEVMVGSFHESELSHFRRRCPAVATAAGVMEVRLFYLLNLLHLEAAFLPRADAFQIPERYGDRQIINPRFIRAAHAHNMEVHVWTVDEVEDMRRLLDWGVDGIMSDYPDRLIDLLR